MWSLLLQTLFKIQNQNSSQESCSYVANPTDHGSPLSDEKLWQQMDGGTGRCCITWKEHKSQLWNENVAKSTMQDLGFACNLHHILKLCGAGDLQTVSQ